MNENRTNQQMNVKSAETVSPSAKNHLLEVSQLNKVVRSLGDDLILLDNVNLTIDVAESIAIVGASGAGKSTLLAILAGLDVPTNGQVKLDGIDFFSLTEDGRAQMRGRLIGFVFQSFQLLPSLTALENVMLPLELLAMTDAEDKATQVLSRVGLESRLLHYPRQLSGGEQQRVAIARAFVASPKILLADEPTGNLDKKTGERIIDLLFSLNREQGTTIILVTHDEKLASKCGRVLNMDAGCLTDVSPANKSANNHHV